MVTLLQQLFYTAILQPQTVSMLNNLQNRAIKLFRFISIIRLFKYFNFIEESERNLEDFAEYDWYLMMLSMTSDYQREGIGSRFSLNPLYVVQEVTVLA